MSFDLPLIALCLFTKVVAISSTVYSICPYPCCAPMRAHYLPMTSHSSPALSQLRAAAAMPAQPLLHNFVFNDNSAICNLSSVPFTSSLMLLCWRYSRPVVTSFRKRFQYIPLILWSTIIGRKPCVPIDLSVNS